MAYWQVSPNQKNMRKRFKGRRFRNQIGGSAETCPYVGDLFWDIAGGQGVVHPQYNAWREERLANGQSADAYSWAVETGCYPTMGNYASDGNVVVAQWGGQYDYVAPNDIQEALSIYEATLVSGATSGANSSKKPLTSSTRRSRMVSVTGRRDIDGFIGTERSTFVSASGCGYSNASGCYANQSGFSFQSAFDQGGAEGLLDALAGQDPYTSAYESGGAEGLLDALAGNDAGSGGGGTGISSFLDSLADPNDISSGEFGGVDSLLDDLAGQSTTYIAPNNEPIFGGTSSGVSIGTGTTGEGVFGGSVPLISGGGDGMPPPPPPMSGGGDGMPPPPPPMSGGGDGMPPPPPPPMSGGGDGMPPPPRRVRKQPSVRTRGGGTRVKSPFANGRSKALAKKSFMGR